MSIQNNGCHFTPTLLDSMSAIRDLCQELKIKVTDLAFISHTERIERQDCIPDIKFIKSIPYNYSITSDDFSESHFPDNKFTLNINRDFDIKDLRCPFQKIGPGLNQFTLKYQNKITPFWVFNAYNYHSIHPFGRLFFIVLKKDLDTFNEYLYSLPENLDGEPKKPILPDDHIDAIYKNTINFLLNGDKYRQKYQDYGIPFKRGILLSGEPGSGKTMTCKWLRQLCKKHKFEYSVVTMNEYNEAASRGDIADLFTLNNKGIIFFDDMDVLVRDRTLSKSDDLYCFLSLIDGLDSPHGIVFVFTTNLIEGLDRAFLRPGRIDLFLTYSKPGPVLRRRFVEEVFHPDIKKHIKDIESLVKRTEEFSFAEIEEIKKLLAFDLIDGKKINIDKTFELFNRHRTVFKEMMIKGFGEKIKDDNDDDMWSGQGVPTPLG